MILSQKATRREPVVSLLAAGCDVHGLSIDSNDRRAVRPDTLAPMLAGIVACLEFDLTVETLPRHVGEGLVDVR